jgi:hexosaminidase
MVLPRMSALAEVLWTPANQKDWSSFKVRMQPQYQRFEAMGANYAKSAFNVRQQLVADSTKAGDVVSMQLDAAGPQIVYTLDGSAPTPSSTSYTGPFTLAKSAVVKAAAFENGKLMGKVTSREVMAHKAFVVPVKLAHAPNKNYLGIGALLLADGQKGSTNHADGQWLGFLGDDLVATLDLRKPTEISSVSSTFLQNTGAKILLPTSVEVAVSTDGRKYKTVYSAPVAPSTESGPAISEVKADWKKTNARFVRITAKNAQVKTADTTPQTFKTWLFADELVVQ